MTELDKKARFLKAYANLPLQLRNDIIYVFPQEGPITWNVAYLEISHDTEFGNKILDELDRLNFI